jgi:hypothetical protein
MLLVLIFLFEINLSFYVINSNSICFVEWNNKISGTVSSRNGPVYAGIPYRNFFLFLNFILAHINIYYIHLSLYILLTVYLCFAFKKYTGTYKFPFRALGIVKKINDPMAQSSSSEKGEIYIS